MTLLTLSHRLLPLVEAEMRSLLDATTDVVRGHYEIMQYHLGWLDAELQAASLPSGKRIRPLLCLLTNLAAGGTAEDAAPAAAGLELLHNFSLIHDDIEDQSTTRRHRDTAWVVFGMPLACNAGDALNSLAHLAFHRLAEHGFAARQLNSVLRTVEQTCLALTEGQYLDMAFEKRAYVAPAEYMTMIERKTGALLRACCEIGALLAGAVEESLAHYCAFGAAIGRVFQMQDDLLGIWGDESVTGKSAASDILSRKKTLPILYAFAEPSVGPELRRIYDRRGALDSDDILGVLELLKASGAREIVEKEISRGFEASNAALDHVASSHNSEPVQALRELVAQVAVRRE